MPALLERTISPFTPSDNDREQARLLEHVFQAAHAVSGDQQNQQVPMSENIRAALLVVLQELGKGHAVTILPTDTELTPQQAAELLGISRPHFMRAIQQEAIPYRLVGSHYRVQLQDVLAYKEIREKRRELLADLITQGQEELYNQK